MEKYTDIRAPVLAIYAVPLRLPPWLTNSEDAAVRAAGEAFSARAALGTERQAKAVENGIPGSRVVRLPNASHLEWP